MSASAQALPTARAFQFNGNLMNLLILLTIALAIPPMGSAITLVQQRVTKVKHMVQIAGVGTFEYYTAQLLGGTVNLLLPISVTLIVAAATDISGLVGPAALGTTLMLFLFYIVQIQAWAWATSFLFSSTPACPTSRRCLPPSFAWSCPGPLRGGSGRCPMCRVDAGQQPLVV